MVLPVITNFDFLTKISGQLDQYHFLFLLGPLSHPFGSGTYHTLRSVHQVATPDTNTLFKQKIQLQECIYLHCDNGATSYDNDDELSDALDDDDAMECNENIEPKTSMS